MEGSACQAFRRAPGASALLLPPPPRGGGSKSALAPGARRNPHEPPAAGNGPYNTWTVSVSGPGRTLMELQPPADADVPLQVAQVVPCTEAEGPGRRFALWFQGCPLRCPGCCNPEMLPFAGGQAVPLADVLRQVQEAAGQGVEGVTLLGGEPLAHAGAAAALARA